MNESIDWYNFGELELNSILLQLNWFKCTLKLDPDKGVDGGIAYLGVPMGVKEAAWGGCTTGGTAGSRRGALGLPGLSVVVFGIACVIF